MDAATNSQIHREDADFAFHLAIAQAANNQYFDTSLCGRCASTSMSE